MEPFQTITIQPISIPMLIGMISITIALLGIVIMEGAEIYKDNISKTK